MDTLKVGNIGENAVCEYLLKKGYTITDRNYHSRYGEIDIIAGVDEYIVFVEVKTRANRRFANPCEFVDKRKQTKIMKTAICYMQKNELDKAVRFDVAEVIYSRNEVREINYIENAFWQE